MQDSAILSHQQAGDLVEQVARRAMVTKSQVLIFADFTDAVAEVFRLVDRSGVLAVAGHASPDVAIAADRADLILTEVFGRSPFNGDPDPVLGAVSRGDEILYVANPNRVTGTSYPLSELANMAGAVPRGTLVIDEHYFDLYGITGIPLLGRFTNVVIVRSFAPRLGVNSSESGFIIAEADLTRHLAGALRWNRVSATASRTAMTALADGSVQRQRLTALHDEFLRLATALTRLGIQNRITPADFMLMRVADPKRVGNYLAEQKVAIENLDGYPGLKHYIRYTMQSEYSNDNLLNSFRKMPPEFYRMKSIDRRAVRFHYPVAGRRDNRSADDRENARGGNRLSVDPRGVVAVSEQDR